MPRSAPGTVPGLITSEFVADVVGRLEKGQRVRRTLPGWGRIAIDRRLPYLCVYRRPSRPDLGSDRLVTSEASYLTCLATRRQLPGVRDLIVGVAGTLGGEFGGFLVIEVWTASPALHDPEALDEPPPPQRIRIFTPKRRASSAVTESLVQAIGQPLLGGGPAVVEIVRGVRRCPPGMQPLFAADDEAALGCHVYGIEIPAVHQDPVTGDLYPVVLRSMRRSLSMALRPVYFAFATRHTTHRPPHFHAMGPSAVVKAVWEADRQLAEVSGRFDPLLLVTPTNTDAAWHEFKRNDCQRAPSFAYRPLPSDPVVLKRAVFKAPVEQIEDPALSQIFREKQVELDRQISLLQTRNLAGFVHAGILLYGGVSDGLCELAAEVLEVVPPRSREAAAGHTLSAEEFAARARREIGFLQEKNPALDATVEVRSDISSLMVSRGNLLVGSRMAIPASRVDALLQHEVGTHVLTYHNGKAQRLRLLATGLAGYDELQEGLAVLAEYLVGGLSRPRLRLLAARVVAAKCLVDGGTFVDTYRLLHETHGFAQKTAFGVATRTHRGGGLTKDAVYLRGLQRVLEYIAGGGELEPLWVGKIAEQHIPIVRELQWRDVVRPAEVTPRYHDLPEARARLAQLRRGVRVPDLCKRS